MSGETEANISGWTVDTLRDHVNQMMSAHDRRYEQRFNAQEQAVKDALLAAKEAVIKAETATEKRFEGVNEFRGQLADQARDLMPRKESEESTRVVNEKIADLNTRVGKAEAKSAGLNQAWGVLIGAVGLFGGIIAIIVALAR